MNNQPQQLIMTTIILVLLTLGGTSATRAAEEPGEHDESAVRTASEKYLDALNRGEAAVVASMWTEDGIYVDVSGEEFNARQLAEQEFGPASEEDRPDRKATALSSTIRFINNDVALEEGTSTRSELEVSGAGGVKFSALWVNENGRWQLDHLRETATLTSASESPLQSLAQFVGEWTATSDQLSASLSVRWLDDGKYLMQHFTVRRPGQDELRSEVRIAWDPANEIIRSWAFHSDGGFVEGEWRRKGDAWVVATVGVSADGQRSTSTNLWVTEGENAIWFKMHRGTVDDVSVDDLLVEFKRNDESH
jgi:uncharacterized protein (TIGR02246 family)